MFPKMDEAHGCSVDHFECWSPSSRNGCVVKNNILYTEVANSYFITFRIFIKNCMLIHFLSTQRKPLLMASLVISAN